MTQHDFCRAGGLCGTFRALIISILPTQDRESCLLTQLTHLFATPRCNLVSIYCRLVKARGTDVSLPITSFFVEGRSLTRYTGDTPVLQRG